MFELSSSYSVYKLPSFHLIFSITPSLPPLFKQTCPLTPFPQSSYQMPNHQYRGNQRVQVRFHPPSQPPPSLLTQLFLERKWTACEDEVLINAVNSYCQSPPPTHPFTPFIVVCISAPGEKINWIKIAELIEGRSNKACRKRWIHSLNPTLRKGRWTLQEDELLMKAIRKHGHCWHKVAKYLPGRTDDQAAKRFREKLDPGIAKSPWTEEEDRILLEMWRKVGCRWNLISRGRSSPFSSCGIPTIVNAYECM